MSVQAYKVSTQGKLQLSKNFIVEEFACRDSRGRLVSDDVLIEEQNVRWLQAERDFFGRPVYIGSAYRTPERNDAIGGADGSHHITGKADDHDVGSTGPIGSGNLIHPRLVCMYLQTLTPRPGGIGLYIYPDGTNWVHVDSGPLGKYWFDSNPTSGGYQYFDSFLPVLRPQTANWKYKFEAEVAQKMLAKLGMYHGAIDGKWGKESAAACLAFQKIVFINPSDQDGLCGPMTFASLFRKVGHWVEE